MISRALITLIGGLIIIASLILDRGFTQAGKPIPNSIPIITLILGWLIVAYSFMKGEEFKTKLIVASGILLILLTRMVLVRNTNLFRKILLAIGWLIFAYGAAYDMNVFTWERGIWTFLATLLVLISSVFVLPRERDECMVDGFGMPLLTLAWAFIAYANSL